MKKKREEDLKQEREEICVYGKMREEKITSDSDEDERVAAEEERRRLPIAGFRVPIRERLDGVERAAAEEERFRVVFCFYLGQVRVFQYNSTRLKPDLV